VPLIPCSATAAKAAAELAALHLQLDGRMADNADLRNSANKSYEEASRLGSLLQVGLSGYRYRSRVQGLGH